MPEAASFANAQPTDKRVTLGNASTILTGPWKFHVGDNPSWSDPTLDDSSWEQVDLSAAAGAHDADVGLSRYVTGWGARGHHGVSGYGWYRIHLQLNMPADQQLAIAGPPAVDSAYQVFWNGRLLGGVGNFSTPTPRVLSVQPRIFSISPAISPGCHGRVGNKSLDGTLGPCRPARRRNANRTDYRSRI